MALGLKRPLRVALIDERLCIGCKLCIQACPVDAIVGAQGLMHTVIESHCIGCDLCPAACPMDCIAMVAPGPRWPAWSPERATAARSRYRARRDRLARQARHDAASEDSLSAARAAPHEAAGRRQALIRAAVARVRARRNA